MIREISGLRKRAVGNLLTVTLLLVPGLSASGCAAPRAEGTVLPRPRSATVAELESGLGLARRLLSYQGQGQEPGSDASGPVLVALSLGQPAGQAWVSWGRGASVEAAVGSAAAALKSRIPTQAASEGRLKLDVLTELSEEILFDPRGRARLELGLDGLFLAAANLWLLPEEIASRRLVDGQGDLQNRRLTEYLEGGTTAGDPRLLALTGENPGKSGRPYRRARFKSVAESSQGKAVELYRGNQAFPALSPESLLEAAVAGGDYLVRHLLTDGTFGYSYLPARDRYDDSYNHLRHAGACYSLLELYGVTGEVRYRQAAEKGLAWLMTQTRGPRANHQGDDFLAVVSPGEEAKLGGAALAMVALLEGMNQTGERQLLPQVQAFARFLEHQQDPDGRFESKYFYQPENEEDFESLYYPGEAILALTRLAELDGNEHWREVASKAADWLIEVRDKAKPVSQLPHDHWLLIGLNELQPRTRKDSQLAHARKVGEAILGGERRESKYLDWIGSFYDPPRSTPAATRSEGLVALAELVAKSGGDPTPYLEALKRMTVFQLRCQIRPENALYLPRPDRALGGFRRGLTDWEVRIDYVQHNLSAMLGLREILLIRRR